jgi:phosphoglycolate phosphatase
MGFASAFAAFQVGGLRADGCTDLPALSFERMSPVPLALPSFGPVRGVLFDIDGTLILDANGHSPALAAALEEEFQVPVELEHDGEQVYLYGQRIGGWVDHQMFVTVAERAGRELDGPSLERVTAGASARFTQTVLAGQWPGRVAPGVTGLLARLQREGVLVGLSTGNSAPIGYTKLISVGLDEFFRDGPDAGFGHHRDRVAVAAAGLAALGVDESEPGVVFVVGDTAADMVAATANGLVGVGVLTGSATRDLLDAAGAGLVVEDLAELDALLMG